MIRALTLSPRTALLPSNREAAPLSTAVTFSFLTALMDAPTPSRKAAKPLSKEHANELSPPTHQESQHNQTRQRTEGRYRRVGLFQLRDEADGLGILASEESFEEVRRIQSPLRLDRDLRRARGSRLPRQHEHVELHPVLQRTWYLVFHWSPRQSNAKGSERSSNQSLPDEPDGMAGDLFPNGIHQGKDEIPCQSRRREEGISF